MPIGIAHAAGPALPLSVDLAGVALAVGFLVLVVVVYDYYRHWSVSG